MIDSLKFRSSKLCEIGKSSRAATSRDKVLSSGMSNRPSFELPASITDGLSALLALALSKRKHIHTINFAQRHKPKTNLVVLFSILVSFDAIQHHTIVLHMHNVETNEHAQSLDYHLHPSFVMIHCNKNMSQSFLYQ